MTNSRPTQAHSSCAGAKATSAAVVSPNEGNEVRREGRQEVVVLPSTAEPGELAPTRTRRREGTHQVTRLPEGNMPETSGSDHVSTQQRPTPLGEAMVLLEEPDAVMPHVRICGSPG